MKAFKGELAVSQTNAYNISAYEFAVNEVMTKIINFLPINNKYYRYSSRIKDSKSIREKLTRKGYSISDITDIAGIRFVFGDFRYVFEDFTLEQFESILRDSSLNNLRDIKEYLSVFLHEIESAGNIFVYKFVQFIRENFDIVDETDYINFPKESGYQSYHITVRASNGYLVEIQARNLCQHMWSFLQHDSVYKNPDAGEFQDNYFKELASDIISAGKQYTLSNVS